MLLQMQVEFRLSKHQGLQDTWEQLLKLLTNRKMEVTSSHLDSGYVQLLGVHSRGMKGMWKEDVQVCECMKYT